MANEGPPDRRLDAATRRRGSRYALYGAIFVAVVVAMVLTARYFAAL